MWTELKTVDLRLECGRPFSFFFDLVGKYWKSTTSNSLPLHRLCTLARKQGAGYFVIECALSRADVREEIDALDAHRGGGGAAEAISIAFFAGRNPADGLAAVEPDSILGYAILINYKLSGTTEFSQSYIYKAILPSPRWVDPDGNRKPLLNNFISKESDFRRTIGGREFTLRGFYYCQQNGQTHVCAHAALRMALNSSGLCDPLLTNREINLQLKIANPADGLTLGQLSQVINSVSGVRCTVIDCSYRTPENYLTVLTSIIESGCTALLIFTTAGNVEHVVSVFGHTRNSDEWHPEAIPAYAGPRSAHFFPSSFWIDHLIIHDDNFGPYYTLNSRALQVDRDVKADQIICIHGKELGIMPDYAQATAAVVVANWLVPIAQRAKGRWAEYIAAKTRRYVLRTILMEREQYRDHLAKSEDHVGLRMATQELDQLSALPDCFWMVEFSLPQLYTGNRSKLGEILISERPTPTISKPFDLVVGLRVPTALLIKKGSGLEWHAAGLAAHSPIYRFSSHNHEW